MHPWPHKLFNDGDLADFLIDRWQTFQADFAAAKRHRPADNQAFAQLDIRYRLTLPAFDFADCRHEFGTLVPPKPESEFHLPKPQRNDYLDQTAYLQAQLDYLDAIIAHTYGLKYILIELPFTGTADLFRYRPAAISLEAPQGLLGPQSFRLRFLRVRPGDDSWKADCKHAILTIDEFLVAIHPAVLGFNDAITKALDDEFLRPDSPATA